MKFAAFKEFKKTLNITADHLSEWLATELTATIRELRIGLNKLSFLDNFECFLEELTIAPNSEIPIRNGLRNGIPSQWIILDKNQGGLSVCRGNTAWNQNYLYLKNTSATLTANIKVLFLK